MIPVKQREDPVRVVLSHTGSGWRCQRGGGTNPPASLASSYFGFSWLYKPLVWKDSTLYMLQPPPISDVCVVGTVPELHFRNPEAMWFKQLTLSLVGPD